MQIVPKDNGFVISVKVVPGSSCQGIAGAYGDGIKVAVTAAAEAGAANAAVTNVLAEALRIARTSVQILRGQSSPRKQILIVGLAAAEIEARLLGED